MNKDFVYDEQKQLIEMWKSKYYEQKEEVERLNNIINELDTFLKNKIDNFNENVKDTILHEQMTIRIIYDYLQELKGSDKE